MLDVDVLPISYSVALGLEKLVPDATLTPSKYIVPVVPSQVNFWPREKLLESST